MTALGSKITGNTEQMTLQTLAASSFKKYTMKHILVHSAEVIKNLLPFSSYLRSRNHYALEFFRNYFICEGKYEIFIIIILKYTPINLLIKLEKESEMRKELLVSTSVQRSQSAHWHTLILWQQQTKFAAVWRGRQNNVANKKIVKNGLAFSIQH